MNEENHVSSEDKAALNSVPVNDLPRLVVGAGRTEEGVTTLLEGVREKGTPALYGLMDKLSDLPTNTHPFRGYTVINSEKTVLQVSSKLNDEFCIVFVSSLEYFQTINLHKCVLMCFVNQVSDTLPSSRPLWLVFTGMGSQWVGCGTALMQLPVFAAAIRKCHAALLPVGLDLTDILTSQDPAKMASTPASFSTIAAMQVLYQVLFYDLVLLYNINEWMSIYFGCSLHVLLTSHDDMTWDLSVLLCIIILSTLSL